MFGLAQKPDIEAQIRSEVSGYLYDVFFSKGAALSGLDRWTQRRITDENIAKIALVLEANDPVEHCYQNLIREIDTEAETGIYLADSSARSDDLCYLAADPGISGTLHQEMDKIASVVFADEIALSYSDLDHLWANIQTRYDRAKVDATVSEIIMSRLGDTKARVSDMSMALRSLLYTFHEDVVRRRSGLPLVLTLQSARELIPMISDLAERGGDYQSRVGEICARAGTA
jgi:hypothetical protein